MTYFEKGQPKPPGSGRKRGARNKRSEVFAEALNAVGLNIPERLAELLPLLSVEKQADVLIGLIGYIYPKRKAVEVTGENKTAGSCVLIGPANGFEAANYHTVVQLPAKDV